MILTGDVKKVEILKNNGKPNGEAIVYFSNENDALRAVSILA